VNVDERHVDAAIERLQAFDAVERVHGVGFGRQGIAEQLMDSERIVGDEYLQCLLLHGSLPLRPGITRNRGKDSARPTNNAMTGNRGLIDAAEV
jgi:hypothetical protein